MLALGVDGCRGGWCAVAILTDETSTVVKPPTVHQTFRHLLATDADVICVDIPIGLLDAPGQRPCDIEARRILGPRRSAVFTPPSRSALPIRDYRAASAANLRATGRSLNKQTFNIAPKIAEVDAAMTPALQTRVREVHPEACFSALNGGTPLSHNKKLVVGRRERWRLLRTVLPSLPDEPPRPRNLPDGCAPDDYIDALVAAWTAVCVARATATRIPKHPPTDARGLRMEMWLPAA